MTTSTNFIADNLQRFMFANGLVRGALVHLDASFDTIMEQHNYPAPIRLLLGETLLSSVLLTSTLKFQGQVTLQMQSNGPVKLLVAKCNDRRQIRALAQWEVESLPSTLDDLIGHGELVVTIEQDAQVQPYQSIIPLTNKSVSTSLEQYFFISEQLPTFIKLISGEKNAAGLLLQVMPHADQHSSDIFWQHVTTLAHTLSEQELLNLNSKTILHRLYHEEDIQLFAEETVSFNCACTIAKMENVIRTFGYEEAQEILAANQCIAVTCEYCNYEYAFTRDEVEKIFA